jgi:putative PIN family toxin of toxin-antitoxin system
VAAKPRIVIDTNVIVSALRSSRGWSFELLLLVGKGWFEICLSTPVALEYEEVCLRSLPRLAVTKEQLDDVLVFLYDSCRKTKVHFRWPSRLPDPSDDAILELAVNAQCDYIVTFNKRHFRPASEFGIKVCSPGEFLADLETKP